MQAQAAAHRNTLRRCAGCGSRITGLVAFLPCGHFLCVPCRHVSSFIALKHRVKPYTHVAEDGLETTFSPLYQDVCYAQDIVKHRLYFEPERKRYTFLAGDGPYPPFPCGAQTLADFNLSIWLPACPLPHCKESRFWRRPSCSVVKDCPGANTKTYNDQLHHCGSHEIAEGGWQTRVLRPRLCVQERVVVQGQFKWISHYVDVLIIYSARTRIRVRGALCIATRDANRRTVHCKYSTVSGNGGYCRVHSRGTGRLRIANEGVMDDAAAYEICAKLVEDYIGISDPEHKTELSPGEQRLIDIFYRCSRGDNYVTAAHLEAAWS